MARFFVAASNIFGGAAYIRGEDAAHFRVLRIRQGETFTVCDGAGTDYVCRLKDAADGEICAEVLERRPSPGEPAVSCRVFAAFAKGDKLETVIQKCVELGASEIVAFPSARCVAKPEGAALLRRTERWQKIAQEAAKQSGRGRVPPVRCAASFSEAVRDAAGADVPLFLYEGETQTDLRTALARAETPQTVSVMTGPEGGFAPQEAAEAAAAGMQAVTLGPRILRCETAPMAAVCAVMLLTDNMK